MNKKILGLGIVTLALSMFTLLPGVIQAYRGDISVKGPNFTEERHESMETAFESNDFSAWQKLMAGRGRVTQIINQENFSKFAEMHKLMEDGKIVEAQKIRTELGLGQGMGRGMGMMNNR